jgi:hypothetical protein
MLVFSDARRCIPVRKTVAAVATPMAFEMHLPDVAADAFPRCMQSIADSPPQICKVTSEI